MTRLTRPSRAIAASSAALALALLLAGCGSDDSTTTDRGAASPGARSASPTGSATASPTGTPAAGARNDADISFATMMIPHHAQAVEMADLVLGTDGIDAAVVDLAERIKGAQGPEIEQMRGWLAGWGAAVPAADDELGGMGGMDHDTDPMPGLMSDADMAAIGDATGAEAQDLFLEQMVAHHRGAVVMATKELRTGENAAAQELAQAIITAQRAEIDTMTELLGG